MPDLASDPDTAVIIELNHSPILVQIAEAGYYEEAVQATMQILRLIFRST